MQNERYKGYISSTSATWSKYSIVKLCVLSITFCLLFFTCNCYAQTEIKNGIVIDHTAEKIVANLQSQIKKDAPFSFSFSYHIKDKELGTKKGKGIFLSNNAKYAVESKEFSYWSNGATVWSYNAKNNEVEILDVEDENTMLNFVKIISSSIKNFRAKFIRRETFNKVNCNIVDLSPMKRGSISKIRIYVSVSTSRLMKMDISMYSGAHYVFIMSGYKVNQKVDVNAYIFPKAKYPKAKIVDLR